MRLPTSRKAVHVATLAGLVFVTLVGVARGTSAWMPPVAAIGGGMLYATFALKHGKPFAFWLLTGATLAIFAVITSQGMGPRHLVYAAAFWLGVFWTHVHDLQSGGSRP